MNKDKPTDITEEKIENLTDSEASAIFREAFYAEGKALEEEALAHPFAVDEEHKEALRRRIMEAVAADTASAIEKSASMESAVAKSPTTRSADANSADPEENMLPDTSDRKETNRKKRKFSPALRWAAVVVLACVGVLGVSMTSQAKGSGLWSSIQRLIGVETRWEQTNNGEDRNISDPEEYKAVSEIEEKLNMKLPVFYYWPGEMVFSDFDVFEDADWFIMIYVKNDNVPVYFEGWSGKRDTSAGYEWEGNGNVTQETYGEITYTITEVDNESTDVMYYVAWTVEDNRFLLSGETDKEELKKILKNIQY